MLDLEAGSWALLVLGALIVGVSKTGIPGLSTLMVAVFATVLPARTSTAALLLLLIVGDMMALAMYRRHADWRTILKLAPAVVAGILLGALFLWWASDGWVRKAIGAILLLLVLITLLRRRASTADVGTGRALASGYGLLGGFTTMVANAGGPVMSLYFLAARFSVQAFLGTAAWFFAIVNLVKVPFMLGLGLLTPQVALTDLVLAPAVIIGALIGRWIAGRIKQQAFDTIVLVLTVVGALQLLIF